MRDEQGLGRGARGPGKCLRPLQHRRTRRRRTGEPGGPRGRPHRQLTDPPLGALRAHLRGRTSLTESACLVDGTTYRIVHPAAADALLDEAEFERDERLPYWAELWPSANALARYLGRVDLSGRRAIELGCGLGLPSVVALARGAEVLATDHYEAALDFAAHNARLNTGRDLAAALFDWRAPETERLGRFDLVLAADVLYEARNVPVLADLVPALLAPGGEALFADPRRNSAPWFLARMEGRGFGNATVETTVEGGAGPVKVLIHRLREEGTR